MSLLQLHVSNFSLLVFESKIDGSVVSFAPAAAAAIMTSRDPVAIENVLTPAGRSGLPVARSEPGRQALDSRRGNLFPLLELSERG